MAPEGHDPNYIKALLWTEGGRSLHWPGNGITKVTYSFYEPGQRPMGLGGHDGARSPTAAQREGLTQALQSWEDVAAIDFVEKSGADANIRIAYGNLPSQWLAVTYVQYGGKGNIVAAEVWLNDRYAYMGDMTVGSYGHFVALHELGHAIGLKHSFEGAARLDPAYDHAGYTVMSYDDHPGVGKGATGLRLAPSTPMLYDIAAAQHLYGANTRHVTGNDVYRFDDGLAKVCTIWDAGGEDTINASGQLLPVTIDLREGAASSIGRRGTGSDWQRVASENVRIAFGTVIENAVGGAGNDVLQGNDAANRLEGGGGNDTLFGGGGIDTFVFAGNCGTDRVRDAARNEQLLFSGIQITELSFARSGTDLVVSFGNGKVIVEGFYDSVQSIRINDRSFGPDGLSEPDAQSSVPATGGNGQTPAAGGSSVAAGGSAESLQFTGTAQADRAVGNGGDDRLDGGEGNDRLSGAAGNDTLDGGEGNDRLDGGDGDDSMDGGAGNDRLLGAAGNDTLRGGEDNDRLDGGDGDDGMNGGTGNDRLSGRAGNDTLRGGEGNDRLGGGEGNDTLDGGPGNDKVVGGAGIDTLVLDGLFADFSIIGKESKFTLTDLNPADGDMGRDLVCEIEYLRFDDLLLDLAGFTPGADNAAAMAVVLPWQAGQDPASEPWGAVSAATAPAGPTVDDLVPSGAGILL